MSETEQTVRQAQEGAGGDAAPGSTEGETGRAEAGEGGREQGGGTHGAAEGRQSESEPSALDLDLEELVKAAAKRDEYLALAQRTQADFENYRKRVARESAAAQQRGVAKLVKELLPALDNLDRAIAASAGEEAGAAAGGDPADSETGAGTGRAGAGTVEPGAGGGDSLLEGVKLVRGELHAALARLGIESFSPQGEQFDPSQHEAMAQRQVDGAQQGCVAEVYQPGWRMGTEVIRPARVLVAA